jgi:hypothetical protein
VPASKRLQPASIVLDDGTRLVRSYRPVAEELHYDGQRVLVIGKAYLDANADPSVQQVMAPHVMPETLVLDPIESPFAPGATQVRTPPTLASRADVAGYRDHWVQIFGTLEALQDEPSDPFWVGMVVRLPDGSELDARIIARSRVEKLVGKPISFLGIVRREQPASGRAAIDPAHLVCEGRVERCGMDGRIP